MRRWLKRLSIVAIVPFLTLALTACPGPDDNGADGGDPAIEESVGDTNDAVEEGDDDAGEDVEEDAEDVEDETEEGEEEEAD